MPVFPSLFPPVFPLELRMGAQCEVGPAHHGLRYVCPHIHSHCQCAASAATIAAATATATAAAADVSAVIT
jgi:hypothetical protein